MGGDTESSITTAASHRKRVQNDVYEEISKKLRASENEEASQPDVNVEQPEDIIMHMKLLNLAEESNTRPAFEVRIVQLTSLLSEIGLNIREAHAFSTADGYSLDTFVVDGWSSEEMEQLRDVLEREIPKIQNLSRSPSLLSRIEDGNTGNERIASCLKIEQTAKALQEAQVLVQLLEKEYALAVQEDLAIANEATSSLQ
ncbi:hypothetical protein RHGRI_015823 [Rhododendron griersonianum]|uniref:ACT domain-containing protein n=1 Tax=Rhododendron griersonianum TaxID=479676 RepID=A0AAV6JQ85_9ERIC|nr:hypothetical protein RHGRI_015823 [Rhododendron griersonianum]